MWIFSRQQTASVACSQRVSESVYAVCVALLFSVKMTTSPWFPGHTHKPTTHHQWSLCSGIRGCCLQSPACPVRLPDSCFCSVVSSFASNFSDTLHKAKSSVKMGCTEPVLIPTSNASSRMVTRWSCMTKVHTWSMSSSFRLVEGLPERASLSTDVRPSLNRLYHSLICVMPMPSSPKPSESSEWFPLGYRQASGKI